MNILQACRAGRCQRSGPREAEPVKGAVVAYHKACLYHVGLLTEAEAGPEAVAAERAAPPLCEGACERYTRPCFAIWYGRLVSNAPNLKDRQAQFVCSDIYERWLQTASVIQAAGKYEARVSATRIKRAQRKVAV
jgi:hypothetical protein